MKETNIYLTRLVDMIFKLIPLREEADNGLDVHLDEYLEILCANYDGALDRYKDLSIIPTFVEARNNIEYLKNKGASIPFPLWRNIAFSSIHYINDIIKRYSKEA